VTWLKWGARGERGGGAEGGRALRRPLYSYAEGTGNRKRGATEGARRESGKLFPRARLCPASEVKNDIGSPLIPKTKGRGTRWLFLFKGTVGLSTEGASVT